MTPPRHLHPQPRRQLAHPLISLPTPPKTELHGRRRSTLRTVQCEAVGSLEGGDVHGKVLVGLLLVPTLFLVRKTDFLQARTRGD